MIGTPRIIPRSLIVAGKLGVAMAEPGAPTCGRTIGLDGCTYRCGRSVRSFDRQHDGIHDAFREHGDGGSVRW